MDDFSKHLRERARELELSDAEVARRVGLAERRYGNYVRGTREPDFATLLRICAVLDVSPNDLLGPGKPQRAAAHDRWMSRLVAAARRLDDDDIKLAVRQVEALLEHRGLHRR